MASRKDILKLSELSEEIGSRRARLGSFYGERYYQEDKEIDDLLFKRTELIKKLEKK